MLQCPFILLSECFRLGFLGNRVYTASLLAIFLKSNPKGESVEKLNGNMVVTSSQTITWKALGFRSILTDVQIKQEARFTYAIPIRH